MDDRDKEINLLEMAERGECPNECELWFPCFLYRTIERGQITEPGKTRLAQLKAEKEKESRKVTITDYRSLIKTDLQPIVVFADEKSRQEILQYLGETYGVTY